MANLEGKGGFKPGQSGNPGGRKPIPPEIKDALRQMTPKAVQRLAEMLESDDERIVMMAVKEILDRDLGKPVQPMDHAGADGEPLGIAVNFVKPDAPKG